MQHPLARNAGVVMVSLPQCKAKQAMCEFCPFKHCGPDYPLQVDAATGKLVPGKKGRAGSTLDGEKGGVACTRRRMRQLRGLCRTKTHSPGPSFTPSS